MKEKIITIGISLSFIFFMTGCSKNLTIEYEHKTGLVKGQVYKLISPVFLTEFNGLHPPQTDDELRAISNGVIPIDLNGYATMILPAGTKLKYLGSYGVPDWNTGQKVEHRAKLMLPNKLWDPTVTIGGLLFPDFSVPDHIRSIRYLEKTQNSEKRN